MYRWIRCLSEAVLNWVELHNFNFIWSSFSEEPNFFYPLVFSLDGSRIKSMIPAGNAPEFQSTVIS
jgi:hypothetical protein